MKIPNKKFSSILLFIALSGLFADKFIPHSHHHTGIGAIADFSTNRHSSTPKEDEEAGEKIHSEFFQIPTVSNAVQFENAGKLTDSSFEITIGFTIPDNSFITIKKYLLLKKIININHRMLRYFTFTAPPVKNVLTIQFKTMNIYRKNYYEKKTGKRAALV